MMRFVPHLIVLPVAAALMALGPLPARAHWDQPHRIIGGLTRTFNLPDRDKKFFKLCMEKGSVDQGLVRPDQRRDGAFFLDKLIYAASHQRDAVERSKNAHKQGACKYTKARGESNDDDACKAIFQLSESIHYLQDCADATKGLNDCRKHVARLVSGYLVKRLSEESLMTALRASHDRAKPVIDARGNDPGAVAQYVLQQRGSYTQKLNDAFDEYKKSNLIEKLNCFYHLSGRENDLDDKLDEALPRDLRDKLIGVMIDVFGLMWAAQDRYAWLFVQTSCTWHLVKGTVVYREGENPEMRCEETIFRVVEAERSASEREQALEQVRREIMNRVTTGQRNQISAPVVSIIRTSNRPIPDRDRPRDTRKCKPQSRMLTTPLEDCPIVCLRWTLGEWQASDGRNNDCCPYREENRCIDVRCTREYRCTLLGKRCDGGVPKPPTVVSVPYSPGRPPGGGVHLGPADPGLSTRPPEPGMIGTSPPDTYAPPPAFVPVPPPAPVYIPPPAVHPIQPPPQQVHPQRPPVRAYPPKPPPQVHPQKPPVRAYPPKPPQQVHTQKPPVRAYPPKPPPQVHPQRPPVQGYTSRPPQQGASTRPPQEGVSTGGQGTRTSQVNKPRCRCTRQETSWFASDGRHRTCCPNPKQKKCIATTCVQKTRCVQWGPPGCVK